MMRSLIRIVYLRFRIWWLEKQIERAEEDYACMRRWLWIEKARGNDEKDRSCRGCSDGFETDSR